MDFQGFYIREEILCVIHFPIEQPLTASSHKVDTYKSILCLLDLLLYSSDSLHFENYVWQGNIAFQTVSGHVKPPKCLTH